MPGSSTDEPAVELDGVERRYGERAALAGVSIAVPTGATLLVLGPNGAGKTTLLRVLATLLRPQAGRARVLGSELPRDAWAVRARIGFVGHEPLLYRQLSGRENLRYLAALRGVPAARVTELLERTGLAARADEPVRTLSRGLVQRLAICRAVLHEPDLLLLDEPLAHLDPAAADLVTSLVGPSSAATRVLTSHDVRAERPHADLALGLRGGTVTFAGPAAHLDDRQLEATYR